MYQVSINQKKIDMIILVAEKLHFQHKSEDWKKVSI